MDIYQPDILFWDLGWNPALALEQLTNLPEFKIPTIILLSESTHTTAAWSTGVTGLLPRNVEAEILVAALLAVNQGLITIDPQLAQLLLPNIQTNPNASIEPLTPRELEVLQHLAQGLPNKTIAHRLGISDHTVKFHINAIMGKLGAQSRTEAVVRATQLGLILL